MADNIKKLLVIGDEACGKTTLLKEFHKYNGIKNPELEPSFPIEAVRGGLKTCVPVPPPGFVSFFSPVMCQVEIDGNLTEFSVEEAASQEHYSMIRSMSYEEKDVIIACFSLDSPSSLENILKCWMPEVKQYCPGTPILLVGTKEDLKNDEVIKSAEGRAMAEKIKAFGYVECSAETRKGVIQVFEIAVKGTP